MIKNLEHISDTKKRLTVEIPSDIIEQKIRSGLADIGRSAKIPGFRPGKAPLTLLDKRFGQDVEADVLRKVVPEYYEMAMKEARLSPVTHPEFEEQDHKRQNPLKMTFTVEVLPEIENLNYEGIKISAEEAEVTDEELANALKRVQAERMTYEPVERPVEDGDVVSLDYEIIEEGKEQKGQVFKVGSAQFPGELSDELTGKKSGDGFEARLPFPEEHQSEYRGKTLTFRGTVGEVKVLKLPEIDDNLAVVAGFENLSALKDSLKADILSVKKSEIKQKQIVELLEKLADSYDFPLPEGMLNSELSSLLTSARAKDENKEKDDETLKTELRPEAGKAVKIAVIINIIGKKENVGVTEEDMKEKILELSQMTRIPPQNLVQMYVSKDGSLDGLQYGVYKEKVADLIHSKAVIEKGE
ncbi:trigger factor [bacterium BMS3Abin07]|nr:trigger factor [bacterium BMS3Abin07]GBE32859.1 trigger factor [bacterium BMS3Bbin05]HDO22008.1 trigger factor [Nitrospirota bacterium]